MRYFVCKQCVNECLYPNKTYKHPLTRTLQLIHLHSEMLEPVQTIFPGTLVNSAFAVFFVLSLVYSQVLLFKEKSLIYCSIDTEFF